jgi:MoxR-like ATPase
MAQQPHPVSTGLRSITDELSVQFLERRSMIEANLIALLAHEHPFNLGVPGTAKSEIIRSIIERMRGAIYFEALLSRTRPDAAILGPYNLPELRDHGDFRRKTQGFLPTCDLAFLDEIGKMSPVLGHDLLSIMNERLFHEVNGSRSAQQVPLSTAFTAANELIADESDDAAALWDRLMVRIYIEPIKETSNFIKLLDGAVPSHLKGGNVTRTELDWADVRDAIESVVPAITVPTNVHHSMVEMRKQLKEAEINPSDRRWRKSIRILQASAFYQGRDSVEDDDLSMLRYVMWDSPDQLAAVERIALSISNPDAEKVMALLDKAAEIQSGIDERADQAIEARAQYGAQAHARIKQMLTEVTKLEQDAKAAGRSTTKIDEAKQRIKEVSGEMMVKMLDMPDPNA